MVEVNTTSPHSALTGTLGGVQLAFFPYTDPAARGRDRGGYRQAAVIGLDIDIAPGTRDWQLEIRDGVGSPYRVGGQLTVAARGFNVQRLTLPRGMVDLDPDTERRANREATRLLAIYRTVTPERLWRGRFIKPVSGDEPGAGFGARRIINGLPRAPHTGVDYPAPTGAPVFAANTGRIALVAEFFFPGRLAIIDHGLGLHTLYFHLDSVSVAEGQVVERGQGIGTVGATGRATGPHLHFGVQVGPARVDPTALLGLDLEEGQP
jgi:murein DD-endopeptidase MepM/ murein hydrolase activator NlpD